MAEIKPVWLRFSILSPELLCGPPVSDMPVDTAHTDHSAGLAEAFRGSQV